jgi:hypothetical protein
MVLEVCLGLTSEFFTALNLLQFGAFTPIYRVHGGGSNTEIWNYGPDVESRLNNTNNLRYRLLPYTYSGFYRVEKEDYTMQRSLAFDFAAAGKSIAVAVAVGMHCGYALNMNTYDVGMH